MTGILCVDKPQGFTSFDVVAKLRGMAKTRKIGHSGTLDPMATGVLPLFLEGATKACDLLPNHDKRYRATLRLGIVTDTQDSTGQVLEQRPVRVGRKDLEQALEGFRGEIEQIPPMYSAVKVGGKRLYQMARQGVEVERKPRRITVYHLALTEKTAEGEYMLEVHCSKGTYVRTLCHDLGMRLGCGAMMTGLRRTMACGFTLGDCVTLEEAQALADSGMLERKLLPTEAAFAPLPRLELSQRQGEMFCNGVRLRPDQLPEGTAQAVNLAVFQQGGKFLGVAVLGEQGLVSRRIFGR